MLEEALHHRRESEQRCRLQEISGLWRILEIRITKSDGDRKDGWEIRVDTNPNLNSLRNLDEFDLLLLKLQRADVRIIADELGDEDYVYSDTKPEPTYE